MCAVKRTRPGRKVGHVAVMWWWAVPVTATLATWAVVLWQSRESLRRDPVVTVQRLSRFRGAMARMHATDSGVWHGTPANTPEPAADSHSSPTLNFEGRRSDMTDKNAGSM